MVMNIFRGSKLGIFHREEGLIEFMDLNLNERTIFFQIWNLKCYINNGQPVLG
ncbi:hypothetical protein [Desulfovibrio gilichinskyi]|uniref:Uncharacterized protein n=1 Tax=Desulfovibrio gilichinskyi TaxID=1519643 RepID=A0A1X7EJ35_9BACT|nr:hypothetical protein [Desulfovibrio gilichinskyi]SMF34723.1 hypothetical protein SAMN06295933_3040 [Desulfovibrio gilichinskyi]